MLPPPFPVTSWSIRVSVEELGEEVGGGGFEQEEDTVLDLGVVKGPTVDEDLARVIDGGDSELIPPQLRPPRGL